MPTKESLEMEGADEEEALLMPPPRWRPRVQVSSATMCYVGCCVLLALQNSSYTLLRRYGHGVLKEEASSQSILAVGEIMKASFSMYMVVRAPRPSSRSGDDAHEEALGLTASAKRLAMTSAPMAVPALICAGATALEPPPPPRTVPRAPCHAACLLPCLQPYGVRCRTRQPTDSHRVVLAMNLLSFVALRRISASAFTLIQQSKIIATAVLSRVVLDKHVSPARWRALSTLLFAVLIICYETRPEDQRACSSGANAAGASAGGEAEGLAAARAADYAVGLAAVSLEAVSCHLHA